MTSVDSDLSDDEYSSYSKRSSASKFVELLRMYAGLPRNRSAVQVCDHLIVSFCVVILMYHSLLYITFPSENVSGYTG